MAYDKGDRVKFTATFTTAAGAAVDPTALVLITQNPLGVEVGYQYDLSSQGNWDASTNIPALADGTGTAGHYYTVTAAGSVDFGNGSITFAVGDYVFYNGDAWRICPSPSAAALTRSGTGVYYKEVYIGRSGTWFCRAEGCGDAQAADEITVIVSKSEF